MKKIFREAAIVLLIIGFLTGCNFFKGDSVAKESTKESESSKSTEKNIDIDREKETISKLNEFLKSKHKDDPMYEITDGFIYNEVPDYKVYRTRGVAGFNLIILQDKVTKEFYEVDLGIHSTLEIKSIDKIGTDKNTLQFYLDGEFFGIDYYFKDFDILATVSVSENKIIETEHITDSGNYGTIHTLDFQEFSSSLVKDNVITLETIFVPGGGGNNYNGAEIILEYKKERKGIAVLFKNTANNLPADFLEKISSMDGVTDVHIGTLESAILSGTEIEITIEDGYSFDVFFNKNGPSNELVDFNVEIKAS